MSREKDVRDFTVSRATPVRRDSLEAAADDVSDALPGSHRVRITKLDATTGNPSELISEGAPEETGNHVQRALRHVQVVAPAFGLEAAAQAPEFVADSQVQVTSSNAKVVHLQQHYKGIPVFQSALAVRFSPTDAVADTVGSAASLQGDVAVEVDLSAAEAVVKAAEYVAEPDPEEEGRVDQFGEPLPVPTVDVTDFTPVLQTAFANTPQRSTVFAPGPFDAPIKANLVWFPVAEALRLGWIVELTMPDRTAQYDVIVAVDDGEILYCHQVIQHVAAVGNVYRVDGASARQMTTFPRPINDYGLPVPAESQGNWHWCNKCQGLFFGGNAGSKCPAGGTHDQAGSANYFLVQNTPAYPGQSNWRWCKKCQGLYFGGSPSSVCPGGGAHDGSSSGSYSVIRESPFAPGQHLWRWCRNCQGLYFGGMPTSKCPAGSAHDPTGSADYSLVSAGTGLPAGFADTWVASNKTVGNATVAHLDETGPNMTGATVNGKLTFNPADATGDDQKVANIFYLCNYMHDLAYMLGFREPNANFQTSNFGRGGTGGDPVDARSFPGSVWGTANMSRSVEGTSPVMNMGLVTSTNRHTAFDSSVVYHEYMHGITGRLVGGGMNQNSLDSIQSGGMGEGWSDYIACTVNDSVVVGSWVMNKPNGFRLFPYDSNYPDGFGKLGTGRYVTSVHAIGEIWCATLLEINRKTNKHFALQLVIDALKLSAANPSFLNMRDHIFTALENMRVAGRINNQQRDGAWQAMWTVFARFGMGPQAASNGAQVTGIVADTTIGQDNWRWCNKCQGIFFGGSSASKCPAGGAHDKAGSGNYDLVMNWSSAPGQANWRWCSKCQGLYFAGSPSSVCPGGGAHVNTGSGDYKLILNAWGSTGQYNWRWCKKCQGLWFGESTTSMCPAGKTHSQDDSHNYILIKR